MNGPRAKPLAHLIGVGLILALACALYVPFLGNPLVFDDTFFFSGQRFSYYATHPFGLDLRVPPYFTLAATQVLSGRIEAHRILSLAFHLACSLALYKLLYDLLRTVPHPERSGAAPGETPNAAAWALFGAAAFAIHPAAVYGAAYLVERSIVLATLFSLLSVVLFLRGLRRRSHADAFSAALLYAVAVLCKEHSVLLPAVAVLTVPLAHAERRFGVRHAVIYLAACAPAAIFVTLLSKGLIGEAYEPQFGQVAAQLESVFGYNIADFPWSLSAVTQAGLFFKYIAAWLWPDTRAMSIDVRVNFLDTWSPGWAVLKLTAFAAYGALGFALVRRRRTSLVGFGMLFTWILFLAEFSVARFQELFVLYRSYLWAPGIPIALAGLLSAAPRKAAVVVFALAGPMLFYLAHDRLKTFSSPLHLWEDAVAKLPARPVPWGSRALYNLGREYLYGGQPEKAIGITDRCMAFYPTTVQCYYARGAVYLQLEQYERALPYLSRAIELDPGSGIIYHRLGLAVEGLGRVQEAKALYRRASELGYKGADYELMRLETQGRGFLPPNKSRFRPGSPPGAG